MILMEAQVTIVDTVVADLTSDISHFNTRESLVVLKTTDLHNKWLDSIVVAL